MKPLYLFDDIALKSPSGKALGSEVQDSGRKSSSLVLLAGEGSIRSRNVSLHDYI